MYGVNLMFNVQYNNILCQITALQVVVIKHGNFKALNCETNRLKYLSAGSYRFRKGKPETDA